MHSLAEVLAAQDEERLVHLFVDDALVLGDREYRGREEIREWARTMFAAGARLEVEGRPATSSVDGDVLTWQGLLAGHAGTRLTPVTAFAARFSGPPDNARIELLVIAPSLSPITGTTL